MQFVSCISLICVYDCKLEYAYWFCTWLNVFAYESVYLGVCPQRVRHKVCERPLGSDFLLDGLAVTET